MKKEENAWSTSYNMSQIDEMINTWSNKQQNLRALALPRHLATGFSLDCRSRKIVAVLVSSIDEQLRITLMDHFLVVHIIVLLLMKSNTHDMPKRRAPWLTALKRVDITCQPCLTQQSVFGKEI